MALFAQIDENNKVIQTIVVADDDCGGGNFPESESIGKGFIASLGLGEDWLQFSHDGSYRRFCSIGSFYIVDGDFFTQPQPYPSWTMDSYHDWQPPTPRPEQDGYWGWNEAQQRWVR